MVLGTVTAATELTIQWNSIEGVADVSSAGQTIPMLIGVGLIGRVLYIGLFGDIDEEDRDDHRSHPTLFSRFPAGPPGPPGPAPIDAFPPQGMRIRPADG